MDKEKRKQIASIAILSLIVIMAVLYFFWGYLNKGTVNITAESPFAVQIFDGESFSCPASPCEINSKTGLKQLILTKEGYESRLEEADVQLWQTLNLNVEFEIIPYIQTADTIPELEAQPNYEIIFDAQNQMYKLINSDNTQQTAIVYFQKEIENPQIFASQNTALIISATATYKINTIQKTREAISDPNLQNIEAGEWSNNQSNFVFSKTDSDFLWLLNANNTVKELTLNKNSKYAWTYNNDLLFATQQNPTSDSLTFGKYHPAENTYTEIRSFTEITQMPDSLIPASNGQIIYFQIGEIKYRLMLR